MTSIIMVVATALVISACGGSSKSLTRAELIAKADPICRMINAKIAYFSNLKPSNKLDVLTPGTIANAATHISATERQAQTELATLTPPSELANDWKQFVAGMQTLAQDTAKLGQYASTNTAGAPGVLAAGQHLQQRLQAIAAHDGFKDCAKLA